jgi:hypothetical protein
MYSVVQSIGIGNGSVPFSAMSEPSMTLPQIPTRSFHLRNSTVYPFADSRITTAVSASVRKTINAQLRFVFGDAFLTVSTRPEQQARQPLFLLLDVRMKRKERKKQRVNGWQQMQVKVMIDKSKCNRTYLRGGESNGPITSVSVSAVATTPAVTVTVGGDTLLLIESMIDRIDSRMNDRMDYQSMLDRSIADRSCKGGWCIYT